jgi:DNA polymerase alpha subunit B
VQAFALFPGQVVAVEGINPDGTTLVVQRVVPPVAPTTYIPSRGVPSEASAVVACGPFTLEDALDYAPFHALLDHVRHKQPDVLLLASPNVSCPDSSSVDLL